MSAWMLDKIRFTSKDWSRNALWNGYIYPIKKIVSSYIFTSRKFTLLKHHKKYLYTCLNNSVIPKGMFYKTPITFGENDKKFVNNVRHEDYIRSKNHLHQCINLIPKKMDGIRKECFQLKGILYNNLSYRAFRDVSDLTHNLRWKDETDLGWRRRRKWLRDKTWNMAYKRKHGMFKCNNQSSQNTRDTSTKRSLNACDKPRSEAEDTCDRYSGAIQNNANSSQRPKTRRNNPVKVTNLGVRDIENYDPAEAYPVNLCKDEIPQELKELCALGPGFVPTNPNIDWDDVKKGFENWKLNLRRAAHFQNKKSNKNGGLSYFDSPQIELERKFLKSNYSPPDSSRVPALEVFLDKVEKEIFNPQNVRKTRLNLSSTARDTIQNFQNDSEHVLRLQDKGGKFVYDKSENYEKEVESVLRNPEKFLELDRDPTPEFMKIVKEWVDKYTKNGTLTNNLGKWILPDKPRAGAIYGCYKTHKDPPKMRIITSACGTATENLGEFVGEILKPLSLEYKHILKDTTQFLNLLEELNSEGPLPEDIILVTMDVTDMFFNIKDENGLVSIEKHLKNRSIAFPGTKCVLEALKICLDSNVSVFNKKYYKQISGAATGPKYVCDYADLAMLEIDNAILSYNREKLLKYARYRDDCFILWKGDYNSLYTFFIFANHIDPDKNIQFTIDYDDYQIDYLDIRVTIQNGMIQSQVYTKPTAGHMYLHPDSCHPKNQIESIAYSTALRLNRNTSIPGQLNESFTEFRNYFIKRGHNVEVVDSHFQRAGEIEREQLLKTKHRNRGRVYPLVVCYNPKLPLISKIIGENIHILHSNPSMAELFPRNSLFPAFKRQKNLKEILTPSRYPRNKNDSLNLGCYKSCTKRCDLCTNFLCSTKTIKSLTTKQTLKINKNITCTSKNVIYVIEDKVCNKQLVGSTDNIKLRLANYKSHIRKKVLTCNLVSHFYSTTNHKVVHPLSDNFARDLKGEIEFTLVDQLEQEEWESNKHFIDRLRALEGMWENKLQTFAPYGLNVRDENKSFHRK